MKALLIELRNAQWAYNSFKPTPAQVERLIAAQTAYWKWLGSRTRPRKLPRKLSTRTAYWQGFADGAAEHHAASVSWFEHEIAAYYARMQTRGNRE